MRKAKKSNLISLVIVEESEFLRLGLRTAIETSEEIEIVGSYRHCNEIVKTVNCLTPEVVLLSMKWPASKGLDECREIRSFIPSTKVVMLSSTNSEEEVLAAMVSGASGIVSLNSPRAELIRAIRVAASGGLYFDERVTARVIGRLKELTGEVSPVGDGLTDRETSILALLARGFDNSEIGEQLNLATTTVRNNITRIRMKLGLESRSKLIAYAVEQRLTGE